MCNNDRLGGRYDPVLAKLALDVRRWLAVTKDLNIWVAGDIQVATDLPRLARAVVGHILAAEERRDSWSAPPRGTLTEALRAFFLNDAAPWPETLHMYVWLYPAMSQIIVRGFGISRVMGQPYGPIVGELLKFFPVAFWITAIPVVGVPHSLTELPLAKPPIALDSPTTVTIPLRSQPRQNWPEQPGDEEVVMFTKERTHVATPKIGARRRSRRAKSPSAYDSP